ncbi:MAG: sigma-70 family RNA polymerase sigma factor [Planctomycetota bacterium]
MTDALQPDARWDLRLERVRRLALQLVRDECEADDLAQEAVFRALRAGRIDAPAGWWAGVMRNVLRDRGRRAGQRQPYESLAGRPPTAPAADDVVAEAELHRRVTDALLGLEEPYRTVLLLRHVRDLPPRAIARQLDRPVGTVKVQLERGRALLRRRLGDDLAPNGSLAVALLPLFPDGRTAALAAGAAAPISAALPLALGALVMNIKWIATGGVLALVAAWVAVDARRDVVPHRTVTGSGEVAPSPEPVALDAAAEVPAAIDPVDTGRRAEFSETVPSATPDPFVFEIDERDAPTEIQGRALLLDGTPIPGMTVWARGESSASTTTDEEGGFFFGGMDAGTYEVSIGSLLPPEAALSGVLAPASGLELRVDAVLVDFVLAVPVDEPANLFPSFTLFGADTAIGASHGGASFDEDGVIRYLVPAGCGCLFRAEDSDAGVSLAGFLEPGIPSSRVRVDVSEDAPGLGQVRVELVGGPLQRPSRLSVWLDAIELDAGGPMRACGGTVTVRHGETFGLERNLLPGRYGLRVRVFEFPPLQHWLAAPRQAEVDVRDGEVAEVTVDVTRGGRVGLRLDDVAADGHELPALERWDGEAKRWRRLWIAYLPDENSMTSTGTPPLATDCWSEHCLPPGPVKIRLVGDGWETVEATLEILAGEVTPWRPRLLRTD